MPRVTLLLLLICGFFSVLTPSVKQQVLIFNLNCLNTTFNSFRSPLKSQRENEAKSVCFTRKIGVKNRPAIPAKTTDYIDTYSIHIDKANDTKFI